MVHDGFEIYFAEKLWEMIPAVYRHEDGLGDRPGTLRGIVEVLASQAAILRRSHDRLWEDQFIELCDDWVVPYLGDLLGTRLVSALNPRGRRVDVAKTIYYRRRKGTLTLLEELISDITGWEGTVVESFRRLGRARHRLDPHPTPLAGRFSATLPGGWADLRQARAAELTGGPFEEFHRTSDVRRHRGGVDGRHGIPKLALHLYRLQVFRVQGVRPHPNPHGQKKQLTFDPSGREVPLFMPRSRPGSWENWRQAQEWELPTRMCCRVLGHTEFEITEALVQGLAVDFPVPKDELRKLIGRRIPSERRLQELLDALAPKPLPEAEKHKKYKPLIAGALADGCGKKALIPGAVRVDDEPAEDIAAGSLTGSPSPPGRRLVIDPERGRFLFLDGAPPKGLTVTYHYGFSGELGAGTYDRRSSLREDPDVVLTGPDGQLSATDMKSEGVTQIDDSGTYSPVSDKLSLRDLTVQAANQERPYVRLETNWVLGTGDHKDSKLTLEGLWIGAGGGANTKQKSIILRGDYEEVTIRHSTLDPGGNDTDGKVIPAVSLVIEAKVEQLNIEASITGPILTKGENSVVEKLVVRDSILQSVEASDQAPALSLNAGEVEFQRVTVFGAVKVHRLRASETLVTGKVDVTDTQNGCFRFSAAPEGSRLPHPYESHVLTESQHYFNSRVFGQPGYAQLSQAVPTEIYRGAENRSEIGAFSGLQNPIKLDSLQAKIDELKPFALIPLYIIET